ncbi:MAG: hypothetical protein VB817_09820, partial [Pirellulaceae bacterium]
WRMASRLAAIKSVLEEELSGMAAVMLKEVEDGLAIAIVTIGCRSGRSHQLGLPQSPCNRVK